MATKKSAVHPQLAAEIRAQLPLKGGEEALLLKAVEMKAAGTGWKDIKRQIPVHHVKLDAAWYLQQLLAEGKVERQSFAKLSDAAKGFRCAELRAEGLSWGVIRLMVGVPEGRARGYASTTTGIAAEGLRIGRGGRFLKEVGEKGYQGNHKGFGTEAAPGTHAQVVLKNKEDDRSQFTSKVVAARKRVQKKATTKATAPASS